MDKHERRRLRLIKLRDEQCDGKNIVLARSIGREPSYVSRMLWKAGKPGMRTITDNMVEIIEAAFGLPRGWMDEIQHVPLGHVLGVRQDAAIDLPPELVGDYLQGGEAKTEALSQLAKIAEPGMATMSNTAEPLDPMAGTPEVDLDRPIHAQMGRLYHAAETSMRVTGPSNVARALNVSPQVVTNWEARGVSKSGMLKAQQIFGCSAVWLETGMGQAWVHLQTSDPDQALETLRKEYVKLLSEVMLVARQTTADLPPELVAVYLQGGAAKKEALQCLARLPEQVMPAVLLMLQSMVAKHVPGGL